MLDKSEKYLVIGAGPAGLAAARNLQLEGIPFEGVELHSDVGGLWDINNPKSTMYKTAHLISSKRMTEFKEFPMDDDVADYPSHQDVLKYFRDYANEFGLRKYYRFNTKVLRVKKAQGLWTVETSDGENAKYKGIVICVGTLSEPNRIQMPGDFDGEIIHSADYKSPDVFKGKRVLVVGAGNSGCDIVVDAVHHAEKADLSVRRGYHFVPKFIFGRPADALGGKQGILPQWVKKRVNKFAIKMLTGEPRRFGFPEPDHQLFESHPIVNSLVLHHIGHGDVKVRRDIERLEGKTVQFKDGSSGEYDLIVTATGYKVHFPFIDKENLNWTGKIPELYLNMFHPKDDSIFVLGMVEATGIGWQGRFEMGKLLAKYLAAKEKSEMEKFEKEKHREALHSFNRRKLENKADLSGPMNYLKLDRMAYYVHKDTYMDILASEIESLA